MYSKFCNHRTINREINSQEFYIQRYYHTPLIDRRFKQGDYDKRMANFAVRGGDTGIPKKVAP